MTIETRSARDMSSLYEHIFFTLRKKKGIVSNKK